MTDTVHARGSGGAVFELDRTPLVEAKLRNGELVEIESPHKEESVDHISAGVTALTGGSPSDAADWLAGAKPPEALEALTQTGEGNLEFAQALLGLEEQGKARKTMLSALGGYIEQATEPDTSEDEPDTAKEV